MGNAKLKIMYYRTCLGGHKPREVPVQNFAQVQISERAEKWAQQPGFGMFHNIMVFTICTMGMWILNNGCQIT